MTQTKFRILKKRPLRSPTNNRKEIVFANPLDDNMVSIEPATGKLRMLHPYETGYQTYTIFATCHIDGDSLYQIGGDSACHVLQPDFEAGKFSIDTRKKLPY